MSTGESPARAPRQSRSHWRGPGLLLFVSLVVVVLQLGVVDRLDTPLRRSLLAGNGLEGVSNPAGISFGDELVLLGYDSPPAEVESGGRFEVTSFWRAVDPGGPDYGLSISLRDREGRDWAGGEVRSPRWHRAPPPAGKWAPDEYASIALSVPVIAGTPPGMYTVEATAFDRETLQPLTARGVDGADLGPSFDIGVIEIKSPRRPPNLGNLAMPNGQMTALGSLTLLDAHLDRSEAAPGDPVLLSLLWTADGAPTQDLDLLVRLRAGDGAVHDTVRLPPTVEWHPTSQWGDGDVWRGRHYLRLPAGLESGPYSLQVQVCEHGDADCASSPGAEVQVGVVDVSAPERLWAAPELEIETNAMFGGVATLLGANVEASDDPIRPGSTLTVTLVWRGENAAEESYRVFLHLLDEDGFVGAQSDGEPVDWTRPTTGWAPGEIIVDQRVIEVPRSLDPGLYVLRAGMYTPDGGRLLTADGDDGAAFAPFSIGGPQ